MTMTAKRQKGFSGMNLESVGTVVDAAIKPTAKATGRPKLNPYAEEKKLTIRIPEDLHKKLRHASVDLNKPMVEITVDALIDYLEKLEVLK